MRLASQLVVTCILVGGGAAVAQETTTPAKKVDGKPRVLDVAAAADLMRLRKFNFAVTLKTYDGPFATTSALDGVVACWLFCQRMEPVLLRAAAFNSATDPLVYVDATEPFVDANGRKRRLSAEDRGVLRAYLGKLYDFHNRRLDALLDLKLRSEAIIHHCLPVAAPRLAAECEFEFFTPGNTKAQAALLKAACDPQCAHRLACYAALRRTYPQAEIAPLPLDDVAKVANDQDSPARIHALRTLAHDGEIERMLDALRSNAAAASVKDPKWEGEFQVYLEKNLAEHTRTWEQSRKPSVLIERAATYISLAYHSDAAEENCRKAIHDCDEALRLLERKGKRGDEFTLHAIIDAWDKRGTALFKLSELTAAGKDRERMASELQQVEQCWSNAIKAATVDTADAHERNQFGLRRTSALLHRAFFRAQQGEHSQAIDDWTAAEKLTSGLSAGDFARRGDSYMKLGKTSDAMRDYIKAEIELNRRSSGNTEYDARFPYRVLFDTLDLVEVQAKQYSCCLADGSKDQSQSVRRRIAMALDALN